MDSERACAYLKSLPHVVETMQWGCVLFWVGDKAIGGRMCALVNLETAGTGPEGTEERPISYPAGPERFAELVEIDGMEPARYLARAHWVSAQRWDVFRKSEWEAELDAAHALTLGKLAAKTRRVLGLTKAEQKAAVIAAREALAAKKDEDPRRAAGPTMRGGKTGGGKKADGKKTGGRKTDGTSTNES